MAYEPINPGEYKEIHNKPRTTIVIDQSRQNISNPIVFLGLEKTIQKVFQESDDFIDSGYNEDVLKRGCTSCNGTGLNRIDMGFLPTIREVCEICKGTG